MLLVRRRSYSTLDVTLFEQEFCLKKYLPLFILMISFVVFSGCKKSASAPAATAEVTDLSVLANAVPNTGPKSGNNYKFFFKALRQNAEPAVNFKVDAWVKGLSQPETIRTDKNGIVKFEDLPFPDAAHHLNVSLHYYKGSIDDAREIDYPYLDTDGYRLKDTQYVPNTATPDPA
jgi:hypothetical protein